MTYLIIYLMIKDNKELRESSLYINGFEVSYNLNLDTLESRI